jgi:hypothetical protein
MDRHAHFLHQAWHQLRFLPVSPLAQLEIAGDAGLLDGILARAGVYRAPAPALRNLNRLGQLRAYLARPGRGPESRFCDGSFRVLYAGDSLRTCLSEMAYHHGRALADSTEPPGAIRVFEGLALEVTGRFRDVRKGCAELHRPGDYAPSQAFGRALKAEGEPGVVYRAVRRKGGTCLGLFQAMPVVSCSLDQMLALRWDGHRLG